MRLEEDLSEGVCQTSTPSFYDYHAIEPIGNWLINLHRYWTAIVDISSGKSHLGPREYAQYLPKIGGAYLLALENLLTQAADHTSTVTTTEVWWELYRWQNESESAADPNYIPYLMRPEFWPKMGIRVTLAITGESTPIYETSQRIPDNKPFYKTENPKTTSCNVDGCEDGCGEGSEISACDEYERNAYENMSTLWDAACSIEGEKGINSIIAGEFRNLQVDTECDSDTDVEARVSPEAGASSQTSLSPPTNHPLRSGGDLVEDEEMFSRVMQSPPSERATFTSLLCDNE